MFGAEHLSASERRATAWTLGVSVAGAAAILTVIVAVLNGFGDRNDFQFELWPAYSLLWHGHLSLAWHATPAYVGAAVWRLPFALVALAAGAGWRGCFLLTALPCLAAPGLFGIWFSWRMAPDSPAARRRIQLGFAAFTICDPLVWYAGLLGHPEELVGICLMIAAVYMAADGHLGWAVALAVFGVLNKPGLGEVGPALFAVANVPVRYRRAALVLCLLGTMVYVVTSAGPLANYLKLPFSREDGTLGGGFFPFSVLWWLGPKSWLVRYAHLVIPTLAVAVCWAWSELRERRGPISTRDVLWLIALLMLMRTALEPWNNTYYNLPFVFALFCLDSAPPRVPWRTIVATGAVLMLVPSNRILPIGSDLQAALFSAGVVPLLLVLSVRVFGGPPVSGSTPGLRRGVKRASAAAGRPPVAAH